MLPADDLDHILRHVSAWEELRDARIFITGGTGFFGRWILESFCHANRVLGLQAHATVLSRAPEEFLKTAPHLAVQDDLEFVSGDVRSFRLSTPRAFTHVIHAATAASASLNQNAPLEMFDTIVSGTRNVLELAHECGAHKFLLTSSGAVYGTQPTAISHVDEEYRGAPDALSTQSAYGQGKRAAEYLCATFAEKMDVTIARGFAFVGPHLPLDAHFAIGNFLRDAMRDGPIRISGDGTPLRSYLYAADLAIWLWEILLRGQTSRAYNVGSENAVSILQTAQAVASSFSRQPEIIVAQPPREGVLPSRYVPSTQRAQHELGLRARIGLSEAILRTRRFAVEN